MKSLLITFALATSLLAEPVKLILDTDMGNDADDAQALALIHAFQNRGLVDLLAVTSSKDHPLSAAFIDAVNTFYGRPDIPVGAVRDGATKDERKFLGIANTQGRTRQPHLPARSPQRRRCTRGRLAFKKDPRRPTGWFGQHRAGRLFHQPQPPPRLPG